LPARSTCDIHHAKVSGVTAPAGPPHWIGQVIAVDEGRPAEGAALLRLAERCRQRLGAHRRRPESDQAVLNTFARGLVGSDMLIADDPQIETLRLPMTYRRGRLRDRGNDRGRERCAARLEQSPPRG
jgi:hypothetical protein